MKILFYYGAKLLLFFELNKFFDEKMRFFCIFMLFQGLSVHHDPFQGGCRGGKNLDLDKFAYVSARTRENYGFVA